MKNKCKKFKKRIKKKHKIMLNIKNLEQFKKKIKIFIFFYLTMQNDFLQFYRKYHFFTIQIIVFKIHK